MRNVKPLPPDPVDRPAPFQLADAVALQALQQGVADAAQQQRAIDWILRSACDMGGIGFRGESGMAMAFHEGRRFVGSQILGLLKIDKSKVKDD